MSHTEYGNIAVGHKDSFARAVSNEKFLANQRKEALGIMRAIAFPRRGTREDSMTLQEAADSIQNFFRENGINPADF